MEDGKKGKKKVRVAETHVYGVDSLPNGQGPEETGFEFHPGTPAPPGPDLVDYEIQDGPSRLRLKQNEGLISITVQAGDSAIGDLYVNIQYEGPKGQPDLCMAGQNALLENASDWLRKLLEEMAPEDGGWRLRIDAQPCPKTKVALRLDRAIQRLENRPIAIGWTTVNHTVEQTLRQKG